VFFICYQLWWIKMYISNAKEKQRVCEVSRVDEVLTSSEVLGVVWKIDGAIDGRWKCDNENDELDYVKWHEWYETVKEIDFQEAGEISLETDLKDRVIHRLSIFRRTVRGCLRDSDKIDRLIDRWIFGLLKTIWQNALSQMRCVHRVYT